MKRNAHWFLTLAVFAAIAAALGLGVEAAPQDRRIEIVAQANARFNPREFWVQPGELVTVTFTNADPFGSHNIVFELEDGRVEQIAPIGFARSERLSFTAPPVLGDFPFYSSVGNDRERGFEGVLHTGDEPTATPPVSPTGGGTATRTPTPSPATPPATHEVAVAGLLNPRGLTVLGDGTLLVAEGGTGDGVPGEFAPGNADGRVQRITLDDPMQRETIVEGLTNAVQPDGGVIGGNHAIWWDRPMGATGTARVTLVAGAGGPGHARPAEAAKVLEIGRGGGTVLADPLAHETAENPDGGRIDSNPWRLVPGRLATGAETIFVVDAGANAILAMDPDTGDLTTYAVFGPLGPEGDVEAVPSGLAPSPNDATVAFVSLLGALAGEGEIRRLEDGNGDGDALDEGENTLWTSGPDAPTDLAFSPAGPMAGRLFVLDIGAGTVSLVDAEGLPPVEVARGLAGASGMAFEPTGDLLVSTGGEAQPAHATDRVVRVSRFDLAPSVPPTRTPPAGTEATPPASETPPTPGTPGATATDGPQERAIFLPVARSA